MRAFQRYPDHAYNQEKWQMIYLTNVKELFSLYLSPELFLWEWLSANDRIHEEPENSLTINIGRKKEQRKAKRDWLYEEEFDSFV